MKLLTLSEFERAHALDQSDIAVYLADSADPDSLEKLFDRLGSPMAFISNAHPALDLGPIPTYYVPDLLLVLAQDLGRCCMPQASTQFTYNFIYNKKNHWRSMLCKLIEHYDLDNGNYTWSGLGESMDWSPWLTDLRQHLPDDVFFDVLQPIRLKQKWLPASSALNQKNEVSIVGYGPNTQTWNEFLYRFFSESAVSLITEPMWQHNLCHFTEKTLYSIMGLTFPIWCSGYQQAEHWKRHGFDVFDDVINHDYQNLPSPVARCYASIKDNLAILQDLKLATELRTRHMDRLWKNRSLMVQYMTNTYYRQLDSMPCDMRDLYVKKFGVV